MASDAFNQFLNQLSTISDADISSLAKTLCESNPWIEEIQSRLQSQAEKINNKVDDEILASPMVARDSFVESHEEGFQIENVSVNRLNSLEKEKQTFPNSEEVRVNLSAGQRKKKGEIPDEIKTWSVWASASYVKSYDEILKELSEYGFQRFEPVDEVDFFLKPKKLNERGFFIGQYKEKIVISIRGTQRLEDVITDLRINQKPVTFNDITGEVHAGFYYSATTVFEKIGGRILKLLEKKEKSHVVVVGHSLGGATAIILSFLLKQELQKWKLGDRIIECWTYGCPPCITEQFIGQSDFVNNIVYNDDVVARLSVGNVFLFRKKLTLFLENPLKTIGKLNEILKDLEKIADSGIMKGNSKDLVVPGILYHLSKHKKVKLLERMDSKLRHFTRISSRPIGGLKKFVISPNMISDHIKYNNALLSLKK